MKRNEALQEALQENPYLRWRYTILSAVLLVAIVAFLLVYLFLV